MEKSEWKKVRSGEGKPASGDRFGRRGEGRREGKRERNRDREKEEMEGGGQGLFTREWNILIY